MTRRQITLLSVTAAVLLAAVLMGSVWFAYFAGNTEPFTLPPPLPSGSLPGASALGPAPGGLSHMPLTVDARNVQAVLAAVARPDAYRQTVECTSYWPGGEESVTHRLARRGEMTRVETRKKDALAQNRIYTPAVTYVWTSGIVPHEVALEDADAEALSGVPTWETVAALPAGSILYAEYISVPGERCLLVRTEEAVYSGEYLVSLETGLLVSAEFTDADGQPAYRVKTTEPPVLGDPGNEYFTLPDGKLLT